MTALPGHIAVNSVFLRPQMGGIEVMVKRLLPAMAEARRNLSDFAQKVIARY